MSSLLISGRRLHSPHTEQIYTNTVGHHAAQGYKPHKSSQLIRTEGHKSIRLFSLVGFHGNGSSIIKLLLSDRKRTEQLQ